MDFKASEEKSVTGSLIQIKSPVSWTNQTYSFTYNELHNFMNVNNMIL